MKSIEEIYQKKTPIEHVLIRPDTYIGSVEAEEQTLWIKSDISDQFEQKKMTIVPGLYKIFDEIIVNAADNFRRDPKTSKIKVDIDQERNMIKVWNNGKTIPVQIHKSK